MVELENGPCQEYRACDCIGSWQMLRSSLHWAHRLLWLRLAAAAAVPSACSAASSLPAKQEHHSAHPHPSCLRGATDSADLLRLFGASAVALHPAEKQIQVWVSSCKAQELLESFDTSILKSTSQSWRGLSRWYAWAPLVKLPTTSLWLQEVGSDHKHRDEKRGNCSGMRAGCGP